MLDIHIDWDGPLLLEQALGLHADSDRGLYQYYGDHPVYGKGVMLYIGSAIKQTFGERLTQHNWHLWAASPVEIYVGRLCHDVPIETLEIERRVALAERILLFSHSPGFNTANLNSIGHKGEDARVLNWGKRKSLFPEVSVSRWESNWTVGHRAPKGLRPYSFRN